MVQLFEFNPKDTPRYKGDWIKPLPEFANNTHGFIRGFIALFKPFEGPMKTHFYSAYWFSTDKGKYLKKAAFVKTIKP